MLGGVKSLPFRQAGQARGPEALRWLLLIAIPVLASGCAMPAAFTVASMAVDTGSYMVSGKTLTDHGLSLALAGDCAVVRLIEENGAICLDEGDYEIAEDDLTPLPEGVDLDVYLAAGGRSPDPKGYARLAGRAFEARTAHARLAGRVHEARAAHTQWAEPAGAGRAVYADLAGRAHEARAEARAGRVRYLAAGMMESDG